jgi:hypothetical protein
MRHAPLLLLTACAGVDAEGLPDTALPPPQPLEVVVGQALAGQPMRVTARDVPAGTTIHVVLSTAGIGTTCPPALGGVCLPLAGPVRHLGGMTAGADGWASRTFTVPGAVPDGRAFHVVAVAQDINGRTYLSAPLRHETGGMGCGGGTPVCGVDGVTYPGACEAQIAGWLVDYPGPC